MRGGPRQIQDSQGGGGGKSSINQHTKRGVGLPDFLFLFYFQTNTFRALGTNGTCFASLLKANSSLLAVKANKENSHNFCEMICSTTTSRGLPR